MKHSVFSSSFASTLAASGMVALQPQTERGGIYDSRQGGQATQSMAHGMGIPSNGNLSARVGSQNQ